MTSFAIEVPAVETPLAWLLPTVASLGKSIGVLQERTAHLSASAFSVKKLEADFSAVLQDNDESMMVQLFELTKTARALEVETAEATAAEYIRAA
jgi:hypothetical protein